MDYAIARQNMVEGQIRPNKVTDQLVLQAMETIPRELFVPKHLRGISYTDEDISLDNGRWLMEPVVLARMLQAADVEENDVALEIGCGTGYATAVLSRMASTVVAVEPDSEFSARATATLSELGIDNAAVIDGDLTTGCPEQGPYDVILISGAVEEVPQALLDQLAEGGRLVAVVRAAGAPFGTAMRFARVGGHVGERPLFDANIPSFPGFAKPPQFTF
jgi:protein-L-isoaspartate(D-aspartate) O-methyltransferase